MQKLAIISSVPEGAFAGIANNPSFWFTSTESASALKNEKQVFLDAIGIPNLTEKINIEVVRAMDGIPANYSADAYILWGSPAMVTEREQKEWIDKLVRFVEAEVKRWKPLLGICFGHQILATAVWWKVDWMNKRKIGKGKVKTEDTEITSFWSHKQTVVNSGDAIIIWKGTDEEALNSPIQMIQYENATGMQLHPEFTSEFTSFLVKLMRQQIESEWLNSDEILAQIDTMKEWNPSRILLEWFIRKYYNI